VEARTLNPQATVSAGLVEAALTIIIQILNLNPQATDWGLKGPQS